MESGLYESYFEEEAVECGYSGSRALMGDLYRVLDAVLYEAVSLREMTGKSLADLLQPELLAYTQESRTGYQAELAKMERHIQKRVRATESAQVLPFLAISAKMGLGAWEKFCLLLGGACNTSRRYEGIFSYLQDKQSENYPTKGLAYLLYGLIGGDREGAFRDLLSDKEFYHLFYEQGGTGMAASVQEEPLILKKRLFSYLYGVDCGGYNDKYRTITYGGKLPHGRKEPKHEVREEFYSRKLEELIRILGAKERPDVIIIRGRKGSGRKSLARALGSRLEKPLLLVDYHTLQKEQTPEKEYELLYLELLLEEGILCIADYQEEGEGRGKAVQDEPLGGLLNYMAKRGRTVIITAADSLPDQSAAGLKRAELILGEPDGRERKAIWRHFLTSKVTQDSVAEALFTSRYVLNAGEIKQVVQSADYCRMGDGRKAISLQDMRRALRQQNADRLSGYAQLLEAACTWEDLIVKDETRNLLHAVTGRMRYGGLVGEEWGFYDKSSYGNGICALFYGPPGTGKTMAAQVMANELGLDLYRIDLGRMWSKYIGETEKNITELFERAGNVNALLFFDEADAFFSRRTQVNDSHDRNANGEVAHLLQKLEEYDGLSVLATNLKENIDEAFKRRMKYMIPFPFPDIPTRELLWRRMLPERAPLEEEPAFSYFAEHFELAGSEIKEVLVQAAVLAAGEGRGLYNTDIAKSLQLCLAKYGKVVTDEEFGYLL